MSNRLTVRDRQTFSTGVMAGLPRNDYSERAVQLLVDEVAKHLPEPEAQDYRSRPYRYFSGRDWRHRNVYVPIPRHLLSGSFRVAADVHYKAKGFADLHHAMQRAYRGLARALNRAASRARTPLQLAEMFPDFREFVPNAPPPRRSGRPWRPNEALIAKFRRHGWLSEDDAA